VLTPCLQKYKALAATDIKRYEDEYTTTYGHPPPAVHGIDNAEPVTHAAAAA
jgi:hypothetical protein